MSKRDVRFKTASGDVQFKATAKAKLDKIVDKAEVAQLITKAGRTDAEETEREETLAEAPRQDGVMAEQFPTAELGSESKEDVRMATKLGLADDEGITPFGRLVATDKDFEWLDKKRAAQDEVALQTWFAENYDRMTPEAKKLAHKLLPSFYQQRQELLNKNIKLQARVAHIKLHGPQNKDDLMFLYALESGLIPADPLENILHPEKASRQMSEAKRKQNWQRGLLNPRAYARSGFGRSRERNASTLMGYDTVPGEPYNSGEDAFFWGRPSQSRNTKLWLDGNQRNFVQELLDRADN